MSSTGSKKNGQGLNLTDLTRDGILRHSKPESDISGEMSGRPATAEGQVVKISDGISYISHDLEDAIVAGILQPADVPKCVQSTLGTRHSERIDTLVCSIIDGSRPLVQNQVEGRQVIVMGSDELRAADHLRNFLFARVYRPINELPSTQHAREIVIRLFSFHASKPAPTVGNGDIDESPQRRAADFVSGMTDNFARREFNRIFAPRFEEI